MPSASGWTGSRSVGRCLADKQLEELDLQAECISRHRFRRSGATWARVSGARLDAFSGMLGHTSVTTTGLCSEIVDKIAENLARYVDQLMELSQTKRAFSGV